MQASKEAKRREDAANDQNWNTLFLQQDAVVDAMTEVACFRVLKYQNRSLSVIYDDTMQQYSTRFS